MGRTSIVEGGLTGGSAFRIGDANDGLVSVDGLVIGTYMHGVLEHPLIRRSLVEHLARRKGVHVSAHAEGSVDEAIDALATSVADAIDLPAICRMTGIEQRVTV